MAGSQIKDTPSSSGRKKSHSSEHNTDLLVSIETNSRRRISNGMGRGNTPIHGRGAASAIDDRDEEDTPIVRDCKHYVRLENCYNDYRYYDKRFLTKMTTFGSASMNRVAKRKGPPRYRTYKKILARATSYPMPWPVERMPVIDESSTSLSSNEKKMSPPARMVLYFLSWSGFLTSFMMRNDINFALVAMVKSPSSDNGNGTVTDDDDDVYGMGEFDWSSTEKAIILSSFYWAYVVSQVVGGVATQIFGTKKVMGWSQFLTAAGSLCIPIGAELHYGCLVGLRVIQGFASGLTWPAMYTLVGYWIPPSERSRFMSSFQGFSIGIGITYPLCGFIIKYFGWRAVFYTTGTIGMLWCVMWYYLAYNTPAEHPRISTAERELIETKVKLEVGDGQGMKVPWCDIFKSLPAWSIGITTFGRIWVHYQFIMSGPLYMKNILGFNIEKNGLLSGTPFICSYFSSVLFCYAADYLVKREIMSLVNVRKVFTGVSQIIPGLLLMAIGYIDDNTVLVMILWYVAVTLITASYAGAMASIVDIAPNLAGSVLAFAQTIHMTASFMSPVVTGLLVTDETSIEQWQLVFGISCIITIVTFIVFQLYGTADIQSWNYPKVKPKYAIDVEDIESEDDIEPLRK